MVTSKCRGRLVGDEQLGPVGQRHGNDDTLGHAAAELMRVLRHPLLGIGNPHALEQTDGLSIRVAATHALVSTDRLDELTANAEDRIQGADGILKDHGDFVTTDTAQGTTGHLSHVTTIEDDLAIDHLSGSIDKAQNRHGGH